MGVQVEGDLDRSQFEMHKPNELLMKLRRTEPYYQRNKARICSFFVRGECKRGAECPYRHEMPTSGAPDATLFCLRCRFLLSADRRHRVFRAVAACSLRCRCPLRRCCLTLPLLPPPRHAGPLSEQNIKDRYYGVNDPVAAKMMDRAAKMSKLTPPEDRTICTLFVGGVAGEQSTACSCDGWLLLFGGSCADMQLCGPRAA